MAKKSKKAKKSKLIAIMVASTLAVVLLVGSVFLVAEVFISPSGEKLVEALHDLEGGIIILNATNDEGIGVVSISDFSDGALNGHGGTVTYFEDFAAASEAAKEAKEANKIDDLKIRHRGNAVYVGDAECLALYNGVIF